jgi:hypothetical protein
MNITWNMDFESIPDADWYNRVRRSHKLYNMFLEAALERNYAQFVGAGQARFQGVTYPEYDPPLHDKYDTLKAEAGTATRNKNFHTQWMALANMVYGFRRAFLDANASLSGWSNPPEAAFYAGNDVLTFAANYPSSGGVFENSLFTSQQVFYSQTGGMQLLPGIRTFLNRTYAAKAEDGLLSRPVAQRIDSSGTPLKHNNRYQITKSNSGYFGHPDGVYKIKAEDSEPTGDESWQQPIDWPEGTDYTYQLQNDKDILELEWKHANEYFYRISEDNKSVEEVHTASIDDWETSHWGSASGFPGNWSQETLFTRKFLNDLRDFINLCSRTSNGSLDLFGSGGAGPIHTYRRNPAFDDGGTLYPEGFRWESGLGNDRNGYRVYHKHKLYKSFKYKYDIPQVLNIYSMPFNLPLYTTRPQGITLNSRYKSWTGPETEKYALVATGSGIDILESSEYTYAESLEYQSIAGTPFFDTYDFSIDLDVWGSGFSLGTIVFVIDWSFQYSSEGNVSIEI